MLKTKPRKMPEVSTASLPDIVFMLLFFFMVTTVMQDEKPKVKVLRPTAQEVEKIEERDLCATILVGYTDDNNVPQIQADDQMIEVNQVGRFIQEKRSNHSYDYPNSYASYESGMQAPAQAAMGVQHGPAQPFSLQGQPFHVARRVCERKPFQQLAPVEA